MTNTQTTFLKTTHCQHFHDDFPLAMNLYVYCHMLNLTESCFQIFFRKIFSSSFRIVFKCIPRSPQHFSVRLLLLSNHFVDVCFLFKQLRNAMSGRIIFQIMHSIICTNVLVGNRLFFSVFPYISRGRCSGFLPPFYPILRVFFLNSCTLHIFYHSVHVSSFWPIPLPFSWNGHFRIFYHSIFFRFMWSKQSCFSHFAVCNRPHVQTDTN